MKLREITKAFEKRVPLTLQEAWDHCGLQLGDPSQEVKKILFAYDVCREVVAHAIRGQFDMIVCHHPYRMKAAVNMNLSSYEGTLIRDCVKHDIAIYCSHTNHDSSFESLNRYYLEKLGVSKVKPLESQHEGIFKLVVFVPVEHTKMVSDALFEAGAGSIGAYSECSFRSQGTGSFKGDQSTHPSYGEKGKRHELTEDRLEMVVDQAHLNDVIRVLLRVHPYEEVAYDVLKLENKKSELGLGAVGDLSKAVNKNELIALVKTLFKLKTVRFVSGGQRSFKRIAICTGSGMSLYKKAKQAGADVFLTGDIKYHQAIEARRDDVSLIDLGHFYSEIHAVRSLEKIFKKDMGKHVKTEVYSKLRDPFEIL